MRGCNCEIKCIACGLNCRIEAKNKIERTLCGEKKFLCGQIGTIFLNGQ